MSSPNKRKEADLMKLMMSDYEVSMLGDSVSEFVVTFFGPKDSPYSEGKWKIRVELPPTYPYKSPSIGFLNKILHPNICGSSGSVCLNTLNSTWTPMYSLLNVFQVFLPQLLLYPNPTDPLNGDAAALLLRDPVAYADQVRAHTEKHASRDAVVSIGEERNQHLDEEDEDQDEDESEDEMMLPADFDDL